VKRCTKCLETKPLDQFSPHSQGADRLQPRCKVCRAVDKKGSYRRDPEKHRQYQRAWNRANPERKAAHDRKQKYGITQEDFELMKQEQGGLCAICREAAAVFVDHNHTTGKNRGLLCQHCNFMIGQAKESTKRLAQAIEYLNGHS
jgi:hypothetical protein